MEPVTTWAAPQNVNFILSRIPILPSEPRPKEAVACFQNRDRKGVGHPAKANARLVPRASTDRFGMDADAEEADGYRCVPGRAGSFGIPGLVAADHAAPGLLPRRQHLLGLWAKPGHGRWISHRKPARAAVPNQVSAALPRVAGRDLETRSPVSSEPAAGHALCLAAVAAVSGRVVVPAIRIRIQPA